MSGGGFLTRWSRRKRGGAEPEAAAPADHPSEAPPGAAGDVVPLAEDVAPAAGEAPPASLPTLEDLNLSGDLAPFLRPGIPASLRRAALRRVWSLDAGIRDFVGPADYAWDFNAPDGVPGFGLELTGDIRAMLAQAIGERSEKQPGEPEIVVAEAPVAEPEGEALVPLAEPEADAAIAGLSKTDPPPPAPTVADHGAADHPDAPPPHGIARRHGSALPS